MYIIIYLLNIFDFICTTYLVSKYGIEIEQNPIGRLFLTDTARAAEWKILFIGCCIFTLYRFREHKLCKILSYIVLACYIILSVYHIYILWRLRK